MNTHLTPISANRKVGPIPVSTSSAATCPDACALKAAGCYAKGGPLAMHWRKVSSGERGGSTDAFADTIAALPEGTLWRHNQAGDLAGDNNTIDRPALATLVSANEGKRGFTYTHKPVAGNGVTERANRKAVKRANARGFTINLSADTLAKADVLSDLDIAPVVVVLDAREGERHDGITTPAGRPVVTCPATYLDAVTCATCQLCQRQGRKVIVGFPAHGNTKGAAAKVARG